MEPGITISRSKRPANSENSNATRTSVAFPAWLNASQRPSNPLMNQMAVRT